MSTPSLLSNPVASRSRTPSVSRNLVQRSKMMNDLVNVPPSSLSSLSSSIQFSWPTIVPRLSTSTSGKSPVDATSTRSASTSQASEKIGAIKYRNLIWSKLLREAPQSNAECRSYHVLLSHASGYIFCSFLKLCPLSATGQGPNLNSFWCISQIIFKDNSINNKIQKKIYRSVDWASKQPRWQVWLPSAVYPGLWAFDQTKSRSFIIIFFLLPNLTTAILRGLPGMSRSASTTRSFSRRGPRRTGTSPWATLWRWGWYFILMIIL